MALLHRRHYDTTCGTDSKAVVETHSHAEHGMTEDYIAAGAHPAVAQASKELRDHSNLRA